MRMHMGWLAAVFAAASFGCSNAATLPRVNGKVTLDGQPLVGADVTFVPTSGTGEQSKGATQQDGSFEMETGLARGVAPGEYKVLIVKMVYPDGQKVDKETKAIVKKQIFSKLTPTNSLPEMYSDKDKTPFSCKVPATEELVFDLKKSAAP